MTNERNLLRRILESGRLTGHALADEIRAALPDEDGPITEAVTRYWLEAGWGTSEGTIHRHVDPGGEWVRYDDIKHLLHPEPSGDLKVGDEIEFVDDGDTGTIVGLDPGAHVVVRWKSGVVSNPLLSKLRRVVNRSGDSDV